MIMIIIVHFFLKPARSHPWLLDELDQNNTNVAAARATRAAAIADMAKAVQKRSHTQQLGGCSADLWLCI